MTKRTFLSWPLFWVGTLTTAVTLVIGCSSTPEATSCTPGEIVACACGGRTGTGLCGNTECSCDNDDAGNTVTIDAGMDAAAIDMPGDATHLDDKPAPLVAYGECATNGSFGWPCSLTTSGPDTAECTDPNFPDCFAGGQGAWCTASCATFGTCPGRDEDAGDAGCLPTACNARGYCK